MNYHLKETEKDEGKEGWTEGGRKGGRREKKYLKLWCTVKTVLARTTKLH